ncbi:hypothetical protein OAG60_02455 [bacterium]|nr:hypothetical protein [bacterium]
MRTTNKPETVATRNADGSYQYRGCTIVKHGSGYDQFWAVLDQPYVGRSATLRSAKVEVDRLPPQAAIDRVKEGGDFDAYFYDEDETIVWGVFADDAGNLIEWHCGEVEEYGCLLTTVDDYTSQFDVGRPV